jgi:hypothetical protein
MYGGTLVEPCLLAKEDLGVLERAVVTSHRSIARAIDHDHVGLGGRVASLSLAGKLSRCQ